MKSKTTFLLFFQIVFLLLMSLPQITAISLQLFLSDDTPVYQITNDDGDVFIPLNVQPGNYTVLAVRSGTDSSEKFELFADSGYTQKIADTSVRYNDAEIKWDEVGFFTIDGTAFGSITTYYTQYRTWYSNRYVYAEMENGAGTGMVKLNANDSIDASFTTNEVVDAYQVYLEDSTTYHITLDVPAGKTFDLFLCYGISDEDSTIGYSHNDALGADESITRSVSVTGYYCIVVTNPDWTTGDYTLSITPLKDDYSVYGLSYKGGANHAVPVQPGNYSVFGVRTGTDSSEHFELYSDIGMTDKLADTSVSYNSAEIKWNEVGFFTIDGTALSQGKSYYIHYETWYDDRYYYLEMENGAGTGMVKLNANDSIDASFTTNEVVDAYQVYLEDSTTYHITLDVPAGKTFDLFLCYGISDEDSTIGYSHNDALGADESITRSVSVTGYYCIVVTNPDWTTGDYTLSITPLKDDYSVYGLSYKGGANHAVPVQPGNYSVFGVRTGTYSSEHFELYSDIGMTDMLADTSVSYNSAEIKWNEVGFFTIDGTALSQGKSYYIHYETWYDDRYYYLEMENGAGTGMNKLSVNSSIDGTITENEVIDAYQVSLDSTKYYYISLDVPTGVALDLFLCYGINDEESAVASSHSDELGVEEKIEWFQPESSGYYCIVVTNPESTQSGDYTLKVQESGAATTTTTTTATTTATTTGTTSVSTKTETTKQSTTEPSETEGTTYPGLAFSILPFLLILVIHKKRHGN